MTQRKPFAGSWAHTRTLKEGSEAALAPGAESALLGSCLCPVWPVLATLNPVSRWSRSTSSQPGPIIASAEACQEKGVTMAGSVHCPSVDRMEALETRGQGMMGVISL